MASKEQPQLGSIQLFFFFLPQVMKLLNTKGLM